jgi:hypothetical protein
MPFIGIQYNIKAAGIIKSNAIINKLINKKIGLYLLSKFSEYCLFKYR